MLGWCVILILTIIIYLTWNSVLIFYVLKYVINRLYENYSDNYAILNIKDFKWSDEFRENWKVIRKEYKSYIKSCKRVPLHKELNEYTGDCDSDGKWRTLYLRVFNKDTDVMEKFPKTRELINKAPCTLAFFSILEPGAILDPHYGIYKGVLRYHLALKVPKESNECYLCISDKDGIVKRVKWEEGGDIIFDDMYMHYAVNNTKERRVVLFMDIKREFGSYFVDSLNDLCLKFINTSDELNKTYDKINLITK
jgi:beta-hydroxylase